MYKGELDRGIARSVFGNDNAFAKNIIENYKPFKRYGPGDLEFGYKVKFPGLEEKFGEMKTMVIDESMQKNWLDNAKEGLGGLFGGGNIAPVTAATPASTSMARARPRASLAARGTFARLARRRRCHAHRAATRTAR